ncbi:MAG TPA: alpha-E domain-containing protein [Dermatophilaceae bacterium]|nr:alpha-E domain-containing protein [Dermatophilaceae bacterium]
MLSRIAESLFWIGRYVERAQGTARLLSVHQQLVIEDPYVTEESACTSLIRLMGCPESTPPTLDAVLDTMAYDPRSPWSIVYGITAARSNARSAREVISSDLWECLNATWVALPAGKFRAADSYRFFRWVRDRTLLLSAITDATMNRDLGWQFLTLGGALERADMTARLVSSAATAGGSTPGGSITGWQSVMRSCGAQEAFVRAHSGLMADAQAAQFLVLDHLFPRSVVYSLTQAEECLRSVGRESTGAGNSEAQRVLGRVRADLEYRRPGELIETLPAEMAEVQDACAQASDSIAGQYFSRTETVAWRAGQQ